MIMSSTALHATQTIQISKMVNTISKEIVVEKEIKLENWMYVKASYEGTEIESDLEVMDWMFNTGSFSSPTVTNCSFSGNSANNGGGLVVSYY